MSWWLEIHCDELRDGTDPDNILKQLCYTNEGNNVMAGAPNSGESLRRRISQLQKQAVREGWLRTRKEGRIHWICPGCQKALPADVERGGRPD